MTSNTLKKFRLIANSKAPSIDWLKHNQSSTVKLYESNYKGNLGIACGKINNCICIDTDFYKGESKEFIKEFGKKYYDLFDTFTNKTGTGGFHMFFEYDKDIKNRISDEHNIDIFTDNKYVVSDGSIIINDGKYIKIKEKEFLNYTTYNDTDIKPLPKKLKEWILNNIKKKSKKTLKNKLNKKQIEELTIITDIIYDIPKEEIIKIINNFDSKYWTNRDEFLRYTSFCKVLDCKDIWDDINKTKPNYNKDKNNNDYWEKIQGYPYIVDKILEETNNTSLINYYKMKKINKPDVIYETVINKQKLGYDYFNNKYNYIVRSDTGTGKTTSFKHYSKDKMFISIVSRISLGAEQYNIFNEFGTKCEFYQFYEKGSSFNNGDNCITTIDSIIKLRNLDLSKYIVYLDEFSSIIEYLVTSSTLKKNRAVIFQDFINLIKNCKQIICTDADINIYCIDFLNFCDIKYKTINNTYLHNKDVEADEIYTHIDFMNKLKKEESFLCCTDSKINAELIYKEFKDDKDCILIVSGVDEYYNLDEFKKVIFSPKIINGLDSILKRPVYTYYKEHTISPNMMVQQISRCRNITKLHYMFSKKKYRNNNIQLTNILDYYKKCDTDAMAYFKKSLGVDINNLDINNIYIDILSKYTYQNDCYNTNKFSHFLKILRNRGFKIEYEYKKTTSYISGLLGDLKNDKIENFDIKLPIIQKINKYLKIPNNDICNYKELFINKIKLEEHLTMSEFLFNSNDDLYGALIANQDFNCKKYSSQKMKMIFINNLKTKCNSIDGLNLISVLSKDDANICMKQYNTIFRNRNKGLNMNTLINTQSIYIKCIRNVLDSKYILSSRIGKTKQYNYTINNENIEYHKKIYKYRQAPEVKNLFIK
jgi:hypothetical protein